MAKLDLEPIASLTNEASAVATLNANSERIEAALEKTLSRDGTQPNEMNQLLDMNSNRIINLPFGGATGEPITRQQLDLILADIMGDIGDAGLGLFDPGIPNTFPKPVVSKLREVKSIFDFAPDGSIGADQNATFAFAAAIESGYDIHVPAGVYRVAENEIMAAGQRIYGDGLNTIIRPIGSGKTFQCGGGPGFSERGCTIENMFFDGTLQETGGTCIWSANAHSILFSRLTFNQCYNVIHIEEMNSGTLNAIQAYGVKGFGVRWFGMGAFGAPGSKRSDLLSIFDLIMGFHPDTWDNVGFSVNGDDPTGDEGCGFIMDGNCGTLNATGLEFVSARVACLQRRTDPNVNAGPDFMAINNFSSDFSIQESVWLRAGSGAKFSTSYIAGSINNVGVKIDPGYVTAFFTSTRISSHAQHGMDISGEDIHIVGAQIHTNSVASLATSAGTYDGVFIRDQANRVTIGGGGTIGPFPGAGGFIQGWGVNIRPGATNIRIGTDVLIVDNIFGPVNDESGLGEGNVSFGQGGGLGTARIADVELSNNAGFGAHLVPVITGGVITSVTVVKGGSGYFTTPSIQVLTQSGAGAVLTPNVTNGRITSVTVNNGGAGYVTASLRVISDFANSHVRPFSTLNDANLGVMGKGIGSVFVGNDSVSDIGTFSNLGLAVKGEISATFPIKLPLVDIPQLDSLSPLTWQGGIALLVDGVEGIVPVYSDGTSWRRVDNLGIVSP